MGGKLLVIDDEPEVARALIKSLERRDVEFEIAYAQNALDAVEKFKSEKPEIVLLDLTLDISEGPNSGLNLLTILSEIDPNTRFVVLTGHSKFEKGIEALNRGAFTYIEKPADTEIIRALVTDAINIVQFKRDDFSRNSTDPIINSELSIKTKSEGMTLVLSQIEFAIKTTQPVLITGETGTGKGVVAKLIHKLGSRKNQPFIRYQPNFTNSDLVASELFGHKKGSFTGANEDRRGLIEEANHGTLFIDEIDALPKETQVSLLDVLQEKTFRRVGSTRDQNSNFRLISALNRPPEIALEKGLLRLDFFHRIAHLKIELPPLRDRIEDIEEISNTCLMNLCNKEKLDVAWIDPKAIHKLKSHNWPGNIRELQAIIEGAAFRASIQNRRYIELQDISIQKNKVQALDPNNLSFRERIKTFEEKVVHTALKEAKGNQAQAAKDLQMDRTVFRRILGRISEIDV